MRHLDLSYEGRQVAERSQLNNGTLPHGGHKGSRKFPPCHLSYDKGREFQTKVQEEIDRLLDDNAIALKGSSPSWALLVSREPSYTDESPLITNSFMAASKLAPSNGVNLHNRYSLLPSKKSARPPKRRDLQYYRPNSTHQYLSATELKNCCEEEVNLQHGRPTRTTLLRARQRCSSAPMNAYDKKRETDHRFEDFKTTHSVSSNTEYLQLDQDGETLHSFLTGARYNRAHCLDSRSVDHTGVYMPRHNPALGCFFTGPKGHEYLKAMEDSPRSDVLLPPSPPRLRRRPTTAPSQGRRPVTRQPSAVRSAWTDFSSPSGSRPRHKQPRLNIVGYRLPVGGLSRDNMAALKLPLLQGRSLTSPRRQPMTSEETYRAFQPPPTPSSLPQPSTGKPEPEVIDNFRQGDELLVTQTVSPSVTVPTVDEGDENVGGLTEEEAAFAAATVAAAIAAAVKEVSISVSEWKEDEKVQTVGVNDGIASQEEARKDSLGVEKQNGQGEPPEEDTHDVNIDDKLDDVRALDEGDNDNMQTDKPAAKGVRFFITEKTPERKDDEGGNKLKEEDNEGVQSELDRGNNFANEIDGDYEEDLAMEQFEENEEEIVNIKDEEFPTDTLKTKGRKHDADDNEKDVGVHFVESLENEEKEESEKDLEEVAESVKFTEPESTPKIEITGVDGV